MNSYEEFLQAIDELYDQNKLDFNNFKLLKSEIEKMSNIHNLQSTEYRSYFKMLEDKISEIKITGGGLTENQVQNIVSNYVAAHKSELTGARGPQGPAGSDGLTTQIRVNGSTYTQSNGLITLPDYPTLSGSGSGLTTSQEQQITTAYNHSQSTHAPVNAEQNVQSNWNETNTSSDAFILNKPTLSTVATSGSYNDLSNKPTIPTVPSNLVTGSSNSYVIWTGTQSQYDSITSKDNNTLYFIKEG